MEKIKIRTGANISNILQSTITYAQAFTELVKNSIQNGAKNINIQLNDKTAIVCDDGYGFDDSKDVNGLSALDKYFVFGNSYDTSRGSPKLGQMGIGGKVANDKLSDSSNVHWTIETKNEKGNTFLVTYKPNDNEFLDDYQPTVSKLAFSRLANTGTFITIHNLDIPIIKNGWNIDSVKKELQDFFGHLVRQGNNNIDIVLNGESLKFDYTLAGYTFPRIEEKFEYEMNGDKVFSNLSMNLTLLQSSADFKKSSINGVMIVSKTKVRLLTADDIFKSKSNKHERLFKNLRGFIICDDLSSVLDHTGMPAKDLSHHSLRDDHPLTIPFMKKVSELISDLLVSYNIISKKKKVPQSLENLVIDVVDVITNTMNLVSDDIMIELKPKQKNKKLSAKEKMKKENVSDKIADKIIENEVVKKTSGKGRVRRRATAASQLKKDLTKPTPKKRRGIKYEIKPFGAGLKKIMSDLETEGNFCVNINSENPKYIALEKSDNNLGLAMHIAELVISELMKFNNPTVTPAEITEILSEFYEKNYNRLKD
tara:strand:- start:78 stop:1691 length:1614 start_codon:yes stop_codon:yes gene_type:complete